MIKINKINILWSVIVLLLVVLIINISGAVNITGDFIFKNYHNDTFSSRLNDTRIMHDNFEYIESPELEFYKAKLISECEIQGGHYYDYRNSKFCACKPNSLGWAPNIQLYQYIDEPDATQNVVYLCAASR